MKLFNDLSYFVFLLYHKTLKFRDYLLFRKIRSKELNTSFICRPQCFNDILLSISFPRLHSILIFFRSCPPPIVIEASLYIQRLVGSNHTFDAIEHKLVCQIVDKLTPFLEKEDFDILQRLKQTTSHIQSSRKDLDQSLAVKEDLEELLYRIPGFRVAYFKNRVIIVTIITGIILNLGPFILPSASAFVKEFKNSLLLILSSKKSMVLWPDLDCSFLLLLVLAVFLYYRFFWKIGYILLEPFIAGRSVYSLPRNTNGDFVHIRYIDHPKTGLSYNAEKLTDFVSKTYFMSLNDYRMLQAFSQNKQDLGKRFSDMLQSLRHTIMLHFPIVASYFMLFSYSIVIAFRERATHDFKFFAVALIIIWFIYSLWEYHLTRMLVIENINNFSHLDRTSLIEQISVEYPPSIKETIASVLMIQELDDYQLNKAYGGYAGYLNIIFATLLGTFLSLLEVIG